MSKPKKWWATFRLGRTDGIISEENMDCNESVSFEVIEYSAIAPLIAALEKIADQDDHDLDAPIARKALNKFKGEK